MTFQQQYITLILSLIEVLSTTFIVLLWLLDTFNVKDLFLEEEVKLSAEHQRTKPVHAWSSPMTYIYIYVNTNAIL